MERSEEARHINKGPPVLSPGLEAETSGKKGPVTDKSQSIKPSNCDKESYEGDEKLKSVNSGSSEQNKLKSILKDEKSSKSKFSVTKVEGSDRLSKDETELEDVAIEIEGNHDRNPHVNGIAETEKTDKPGAMEGLNGHTPVSSEDAEQQKAAAAANKFKVTRVGFSLGGTTPEGESPDNEGGENSQAGEVAPASPNQTYATYNMKTFGQDTLETLPNVDHYRNLFTQSGVMRKRPTLAELHDMQRRHDEPEEIAALLAKGDTNGHVTRDAAEPDKPPVVSGPKFGWITGVLVRCLLNIFGVMLFLRLSWVVGQAGIGLSVVIVLLATCVTFITALSMSAICTNGEVKGGGAYYMISRSLGPEFGGAIGIVFSMANAVAVAMYVVGFAETIRDILAEHDLLMVGPVHDVRIIGAITALLLLGIAMIGLAWEARAQLVLLVILVIAIGNYLIGSFIPASRDEQSKGFIGYSATLLKENMGPDFRGESFFTVFAIFFPAATGILAGANISGDLTDPQKAIPKGTLLAIVITSTTYIVMTVIAGLTVERDATGIIPFQGHGSLAPDFNENTTEMFATELPESTAVLAVTDVYMTGNGSWPTSASSADAFTCPADGCPYGLMNDMQVGILISAWGPITIAGIIAATLSSALASLISAPKVFQAVCKDKIFPYIHVFGTGYGNGDEPRRAYILAFIIALGCILIGQLNAIAPLISNFFLMSYALINYSCFDASLAKTPGWRPAFKYYSKWAALAGSILCLSVMFLMSWPTALVTFALICFLYMYVHHTKPDINWGSSTQAHVYKSALQHSLKLVSVVDHVKNYRPQLLVMTGYPADRPALVDFASNITKGVSLMMCGNIIQDDDLDRLTNPKHDIARAHAWLHRRKAKAFYTQIAARQLRAGVRAMLQCTGTGKMRPNVLLQGFKASWKTSSFDDVENYVDIIHDALSLQYGVGILRLKEGLSCEHLNADPAEDDPEPNMPRNSSSVGNFEVPAAQGPSDYLLAPPRGMVKSASGCSSQGSSGDPVLVGYKPRPAQQAPSGRRGPTLERSESQETVVDIVEHDEEPNDVDEIKNVDMALISNVNRFQRKQGKGTIDVYWLFDDGGLTLLLPYILSKKSQWSNCKLRVFVAGSKEIHLDRDKRHMATLLSKFRIDYASMTVIPDISKKPDQALINEFNELIAEVRETHKIHESELLEFKMKTYRHLRCRELLLQHSSQASLVVMTLPMPKKQLCSSGLYMAWLDMLTKDMPPILLLRGNQESVLTFYS